MISGVSRLLIKFCMKVVYCDFERFEKLNDNFHRDEGMQGAGSPGRRLLTFLGREQTPVFR